MKVEQREKGPILALDTSTAAMAAAIVNGQDVLAEVQSMAERNHSVHVVSHLKELLHSSGVTKEELAGIAVGKGPGSYTGMRIAVAAAKTLAWAWSRPLVGVSSLEALAYGAWHRVIRSEADRPAELDAEQEHWVLPFMDARRGQVYTSGFSMNNRSEWTRWADDGVRLMKNWVDLLEERMMDNSGAVGRISLVGDLTLHEAEAERLQQAGFAAGIDVRIQPFVQEGRWVAQLGRQQLEAGLIENTHSCIPNYTQLTEAEVKWQAKQAGESGA